MKNTWILERFAAVDRKDIDGFINMLSEDHKFIFGARPPVVGKDNAREVVNHFWTLIGRLRHNIWRVREADDIAYVEALIEYERLDGHVILVPCCDVVRHNGSVLIEQRAYLDQTAIFADLSSGEHAYKDHWIESIPEARRALGLAPTPDFL